MRLFVLALFSLGLHAQETATPPKTAKEALKDFMSQRAQQNAIPRSQSQSVIDESLRNKAMQKLAEMKQKFGQEPESKVCSIPLLNATPNVKGTMRTITPDDTEPNMPKLRMPAPACK